MHVPSTRSCAAAVLSEIELAAILAATASWAFLVVRHDEVSAVGWVECQRPLLAFAAVDVLQVLTYGFGDDCVPTVLVWFALCSCGVLGLLINWELLFTNLTCENAASAFCCFFGVLVLVGLRC